MRFDPFHEYAYQCGLANIGRIDDINPDAMEP